MAKRSGYTVVELLIVLLLLGTLLMVAFRPMMRWRDRAAVVAARDEIASALARTRVTAISAAGATLMVDPGSGRFWIRTEQGPATRPVDLARRYRVAVEVGADIVVGFHYDALGIGRLTSRTVRIRRRGQEAGLTVSAYGRYRRW